MGLFDKVMGKKDEGPVALNEREAFSAVCVMAVAADGVIEEEEIRRVVTHLAERKQFRGEDLRGIANQLTT